MTAAAISSIVYVCPRSPDGARTSAPDNTTGPTAARIRKSILSAAYPDIQTHCTRKGAYAWPRSHQPYAVFCEAVWGCHAAGCTVCACVVDADRGSLRGFHGYSTHIEERCGSCCISNNTRLSYPGRASGAFVVLAEGWSTMFQVWRAQRAQPAGSDVDYSVPRL